MTPEKLQDLRNNYEQKIKQGDLNIRKMSEGQIDVSLLDKVGKNLNGLLRDGQHQHRQKGGVQYIDRETGAQFLLVSNKAIVSHPQHDNPNGPYELDKGVYFISPTFEVGMFNDMKQEVID